MSSGKVPTRNVVPAKRPAADHPQPARAPARPTQRLTDAQRNVLLEDMRETPPAAPIDDEELEVEMIQVAAEETAAPAKKRASTNAHVARRKT